MPRYYFDLHDGEGLIADEEGRDLADLALVRVEALKGIRSILSAEVVKGHLDLTGRMIAHDEAGADVLVLPYGEAVTVTRA
jgi:hypothetical protein